MRISSQNLKGSEHDGPSWVLQKIGIKPRPQILKRDAYELEGRYSMGKIIAICREIAQSGGESGKQRSTPLDFRTSFETLGFLRIQYVTGVKHCSDIQIHILLDGKEVHCTGFLGPISGVYSVDISLLTSPGTHELTLSPEGKVGGCNQGTLYSWEGTLTIWTQAK